MIKIQDLSFGYSRRKPPVFADFSLSLSEGGVYGLLGSNGAGKSTLLYLMAGMLTPYSGKVYLDGVDTRDRKPLTLADMFLVPEEFDLPSLSIRKYAEVNGALYPDFSMQDMMTNLEIFGMDPELNLSKISMGQKKKAFLSFAMACNTKVVILDEPTNGLDIPGKSAFRRYIANAMSDDRIFIISTHQVRDVTNILDHIIIIDDSHVLLNQPVYEIQKRLRFTDTIDRELISEALYSEQGLAGAAVILPNTADEDTTINLELLFNFAHADRNRLNQVFEQSAESSFQ